MAFDAGSLGLLVFDLEEDLLEVVECNYVAARNINNLEKQLNFTNNTTYRKILIRPTNILNWGIPTGSRRNIG